MDGAYSALNKIGVSCKTCEVSESFYSTTSVKRFRLEHAGHEVVDGRIYSPTNGGQDTEQAERVRLLRVLVELVNLPSYPAPVFTITGVKDNLKSAFVQVVSPSQKDQVRETLERGKYLDSGLSDTIYVWEPKSISFSDDANLAMSFGANAPDARPSADAPSASGNETRVDQSGALEAPTAVGQAEPTPSVPGKESADAAIALPASEGAVSAAPTTEVEEAPAPVVPNQEESDTLSTPEASREAEVEEDKRLLVSRSWNVEGGSKNVAEAERISEILWPFRRTTQPPYTIGVIVDDILSVEAANGEIGGDLTKKIEGAGYRLSRVSVVEGRPVAWFRKERASGQDAPGA